jgi:hypothetical protein
MTKSTQSKTLENGSVAIEFEDGDSLIVKSKETLYPER